MAAQLENIQSTDRRVRTFFRKTELCRFFEAGRCLKGDDCNFAHGQDERKTVPDLTKTAMCKSWAQGSCELSSEQCAFAHGKCELRQFRDRVRQAHSKSTLRGSGENVVLNTSEDEEGHFQTVIDSDSIFQVEQELKTSSQSLHGQGEIVKNAALIQYASPNMFFDNQRVKDQGSSKPEDAVSDLLLLSAAMFCALPSPTQQVLLSTSLVRWIKIQEDMAACFDKDVLCRTLLEFMSDHYDD